MSSFGKRVDGPGGRRRTNRRLVTMLGTAMSIEGSKSVIVEDLAPSGAKLVGRGLPPAGKEILLRAGEVEAFGRVMWAEDDCRGIEFEGDLPN